MRSAWRNGSRPWHREARVEVGYRALETGRQTSPARVFFGNPRPSTIDTRPCFGYESGVTGARPGNLSASPRSYVNELAVDIPTPPRGPGNMIAHFRRGKSLVAALLASLAVASSAGAQQIVGFGAAEFSGQRRSVQLLGFAVSSGLPGWSPVLTVTGLRFTFPDGLGGTADAFAVAPSLGMRYQTETGSVGGHVGYIFVADDATFDGVTGSPVGSSDGMFVTFQADHWGRGESIGQLIASYNFGGEYLWSRAKGGVRFGGLSSPLFVGAEAIFQGGGEGSPDTYVLQAGPVLMFQLTPNFRLDLSGGVRVPIDDPADEGTGGYGRIEFVAVLPRFFR